MIAERMHFFWTGFYRVQGDELVLGPFQGGAACFRIARGRGVCGTAWQRAATVVVPDVDAFPGHIACSSESRSEIVVPVMKGGEADRRGKAGGRGEVLAVLDIDSDKLADFDSTDAAWLELIATLVTG